MTSLPVFQSIEAEKRREPEDGTASARSSSRGAAAETIAKRNTTAIIRVTLAAKTPNGKQTLLYAADEVVKAAPPKPKLFFSRRTRYGPAVRRLRPGRSRPLTLCQIR
jgi:hypothetical protein